MRFLTAVLACVLSGALGVAMAEEPSKTLPPDPASTPAIPSSEASSPPATPAPAASTPASAPTTAEKPPAEDQLDKHFIAEGYTVQVRNGQKYYCKYADVLGSRLKGSVQCSPAQELMVKERQVKDDTKRWQSISVQPSH